ncbi:MAG: Do family serine endopeptidase [Bacteroidales bacterium]|jgi:Do/DeqQ family serine protease|nr:Do family serine endopeptidase [Bacteroidales bacterium]
MKAQNLLGNVVISLLSAFLAIIIYANFYEKELAKAPDAEEQKQSTLELINDSNQVRYTQYPVGPGGEIFDFTTAAENSVNAVVHVTSKYNLENDQYYGNPLYEFFFGDRYSRQPAVSFGSGVIISEDGYIVTNNHVIERSDEIQVVLNDRRTYAAELVGTDPGTDLALLKIDGKELPFITMGNSDQIKVGEWVLAVGNPFNLTSTVTAGIVSAKARNINILRDQQYPIESYIQTDAAVNKGNSGGALVNMQSELVGINSAILSPSGAYSGYSFAIPVNIVRKVVSDIIKYGEVQRAVLGVEIRDVNNELLEEYNLDKIEGVFIAGVTDDGAAKEAGLKSGDVILQINDVKINSIAELTAQIGRYRPGEKVNITIKRDRKKKQIEVILRNMHGTTKIIKADEYLAILGANFQKLNPNDKRRLGIETGVKVVDIKDNGALKKAGVKEGFVITYIQGEKISHIDDIKRVLRNTGLGVEVEVEGMYPGGRYIYVYRVNLE